MAITEQEPLLLRPQPDPPSDRAWGGLAATAAALLMLLLLLLSASGALRPTTLFLALPPEPVALTLLTGAHEKGSVCLDGTPPVYHMQRGSGDGSSSWLIHLEGGAWCSTVKDCSNRSLTELGSSNFMKPMRFAGSGILSSDQLENPDAGFFLDVKDISGERSFWSVYDRVVHLQNVRKVLPKDCLANKEPTECFFPAELIKSIHVPMFILNSAYDSWQIRNVLVPGSCDPDKSWLSCKDNIRNCNSTQHEVLDEFRQTMVNDLKVVQDKEDWSMFIDSCFTHCQTLVRISWNSPISPRLGNKTIAEAVGDWYFERSRGVKEIDCEYPCNPTCSSLLPP